MDTVLEAIRFSNNRQFECHLEAGKTLSDNAFDLANLWLNQRVEAAEAIAAAAAVCCQCRWAAVSQVHPGASRVAILALFDSGKFVDCFTYDFETTPCEQVLANDKFCRFEDVQRAFPEDADLKTMGVADYAGKAFRNQQHEVVGHLFVMDEKPFSNDPELEEIISRLVSLMQVEVDGLHS